ncbi:MAG: hypothetical protein A2Y54_01475 [Chloroflexi bacterium RBG_16_51_16]|nr:MAG: hypothetical protein A2Y54_01475 [Chloroflexi bacterium RBG_16_51_16]
MKRWLQYLFVILLSFWLVTLIMVPKDPLKVLPGRDSGVFLYGGQQVLAGSVPYIDFWDHKGPLIYYVNAIGLLIGQGSRWGVWMLEFLCLVAICLGLYWMADHAQGGLAGIASMGFGAVLLSRGGPYHLDTTNYVETYSIFLNITGVVLWSTTFNRQRSTWRWAMIGVMLGLSFCLRPNNIGTAIAISGMEIYLGYKSGALKNGFRNLLGIMTGTLVILAILFGVLLAQGAFQEFIDQVFVYNFFYTQFGSTGPIQILSQGITGWVWLPAMCYLGLATILNRTINGEKKARVDFPFFLFLLIGLPIEIAITLLSQRVYTHYFILWVPYLAWLIGCAILLIPQVIQEQINRIPSYILPVALAAGLIVVNSQTIQTISRQFNRLALDRSERHTEVINPIVDYVTVNTEPGENVLVWGNDVWINYLADRQSPTRYIYQYPLFMPGYTHGKKVSEFLEDMRTDPPNLIVSTQKVDYRDMLSLETLLEQQGGVTKIGLPIEFEAVIAFIKRNYCVHDTIRGATIYQLFDGATTDYSCP